MAEGLEFEMDMEPVKADFRLYAELANTTVYAAIYKFARKLAFELYAQTRDVAPEVQAIFELPAKLQWHIKRRRAGLGVEQEIWLRARAVGYTSLGWLSAAKEMGMSKSKGEPVEDESEPDASDLQSRTEIWKFGGIEIHLNGTEPYIQIVNMTTGVEHVEAAHGIVERALASVTADMEKYIQRKLDELTDNMSMEGEAAI